MTPQEAREFLLNWGARRKNFEDPLGAIDHYRIQTLTACKGVEHYSDCVAPHEAPQELLAQIAWQFYEASQTLIAEMRDHGRYNVARSIVGEDTARTLVAEGMKLPRPAASG